MINSPFAVRDLNALYDSYLYPKAIIDPDTQLPKNLSIRKCLEIAKSNINHLIVVGANGNSETKEYYQARIIEFKEYAARFLIHKYSAKNDQQRLMKIFRKEKNIVVIRFATQYFSSKAQIHVKPTIKLWEHDFLSSIVSNTNLSAHNIFTVLNDLIDHRIRFSQNTIDKLLKIAIDNYLDKIKIQHREEYLLFIRFLLDCGASYSDILLFESSYLSRTDLVSYILNKIEDSCKCLDHLSPNLELLGVFIDAGAPIDQTQEKEVLGWISDAKNFFA